MLRYHMAVVTSDKRLRREVKRVTTATNATADFVADASELASDKKHVNLVIYDARKEAPSDELLDALPREAAISYILEGNNLFKQAGLLHDERVESLLCRDEVFDDDEFIASATKSLRHDIFGLHKYFPWGVTNFSMKVKNYAEKTEAIENIMQFAQESGMRGPVRERIQLVCDELMMNALYHAPRDEKGQELYRHKPRKELARLAEVSPIHVQYGCSGRYFGVAVRDSCGSLTRSKILDYLLRIRDGGGGAEIEDKSSGAGLGLISVVQSVSKLVFNMHPGSATEVIALFDMDLISRGRIGAQSLHLFTLTSDADVDQSTEWHAVTDGADPQPDDGAPETHPPAGIRPRQDGQTGRWSLVALLLSITTAMGIAYYYTQARRAAATAPVATFAIVPDPPDAEISLNGTPIGGNRPMPLPQADVYELVVEKPGHQSWRKSFTPAEISGNVRLYVNLSHEE